jgi:phage shock protein A
MRDIVSSNFNAMLDRAEDPEKLARQMIQEMEDTLVEIKARCAAAMAQCRVQESAAKAARRQADTWAVKARMAVEKGRDDLAREALLEKRNQERRAQSLEEQKAECEKVVERYQSDRAELESRIGQLLERKRVLVQRHQHAMSRKRAQQTIRRVDSADAIAKIEALERRADRLSAEADLVNYGAKTPLEERFEREIGDADIEDELRKLKAARATV